MLRRTLCRLFLCICLVALGLAAPATGAEADQPLDFAHDILPLLKNRCAKCHTSGTYKGEFSMDSRETLLESGAVEVGKSAKSTLVERITSDDPELRMPPTGAPLTAEEIALMKRWIDSGLAWEEGFSFKGQKYKPQLALRKPELPPAAEGRTNPIDRIVDAYFAEKNVKRPAPLSDAAFSRRVHLDLIGMLPTIDEQQAFVDNADPAKREKLVRNLLARNRDFADHWLTFWNDHLRNDYQGTGYIDGGRKQISAWLYQSLYENKPYDQFVRELISPTPESEGFVKGIQWRGNVNASQEREIQFAQNVGQVLLGENLKCASCHDSFIDDWKLEDSYNLAAVFSSRKLELHRCDQPTGKFATPAFIYAELGEIDASKPPAERLAQLALIITSEQNGRLPRTIVNRLWHRLQGRGIVHPVDIMSNEPWSEDLLDYLAVHLVENKYDLKKTLELICTSQAYQSQCVSLEGEPPATDFVYHGPIAKRLTAEQFVDALWQLTGTGPKSINAPIKLPAASAGSEAPIISAKWIWNSAKASSSAPGEEQITLRRTFTLNKLPTSAVAVITCDNEYILFINGKKIAADVDWQTVETLDVKNALRQGENTIVAVATNATKAPNAAAFYFALIAHFAKAKPVTIVSDDEWTWTANLPEPSGAFKAEPTDWQPAAVVTNQNNWGNAAQSAAQTAFSQSPGAALTVRAALVNSDALMRSLGRPNREQVVTTRPEELSTLQALDLANSPQVYEMLMRGAKQMKAAQPASGAALIERVYWSTLGRKPSEGELAIAAEMLGEQAEVSDAAVADLLWTIVMLPEFQMVR